MPSTLLFHRVLLSLVVTLYFLLGSSSPVHQQTLTYNEAEEKKIMKGTKTHLLQ